MFDFVQKFKYYPDKLTHFIHEDYDRTLATVLLYIGSGICNNDCIFCDKNFYKIKPFFFDLAFLDQLIKDMVALGADSLIILGEGAEPLLCPNLSHVIDNATHHGIACGLYTNGSVVNSEIVSSLNKLDFLRVSLDAGSQTTHQMIHRYPPSFHFFNNALDLLKSIDKSKVNSGASYIVMHENVGEVFRIWLLLNEIGVGFLELKLPLQAGYVFNDIDEDFLGEIKFQLQQINAFRDVNTRLVLNNHLKMLLADNTLDAVSLTIQNVMPCYTSTFRTVVSPLGYFMCSPRKNNTDARYGDPNEETLKEAWSGCRRKQLIGRECAIRCAYCQQNMYLQDLRKGLEMAPPNCVEEGQRHFL